MLGGNKCKLFFGIVFMGNFFVIFFDEFFFGFDVVVKRIMWCIFVVIVLGCLILLMIYLMEEVDVLVGRVGIFVKRMFVMGSIEYFWNKFGDFIYVYFVCKGVFYMFEF